MRPTEILVSKATHEINIFDNDEPRITMVQQRHESSIREETEQQHFAKTQVITSSVKERHTVLTPPRLKEEVELAFPYEREGDDATDDQDADDSNSNKIVGDVARRVTVFAEFDDAGVLESSNRPKLGAQTSKKE